MGAVNPVDSFFHKLVHKALLIYLTLYINNLYYSLGVRGK